MARGSPRSGRLSLFILTVVFFLLSELVRGRSTSTASNTTIASNNNDPKVHCDRTHWYDICWFFFANYILHALSVRSLPGENFYSATVFKFCCLLIPFTGLRRGLSLISRGGNLAGNDLQAAARANALCMVIRKPDWRPHVGDEISGCQLVIHSAGAIDTPVSDQKKDNNYGPTPVEKVESGSSSEQGNTKDDKALQIQIIDHYSPRCDGLVDRVAKVLVESFHFQNKSPSSSVVDHSSVKIHGRCELSEGYALAYVPADMKVYPRTTSVYNASNGIVTKDSFSQTRIASAHDFPQILFSLTQTVSGAYALYRARGSQIERYGYAAFGLTVLPFILMSLINFLGSLLTSEYETIFLIYSSLMDEMINRGGISDGVVGSIHAPVEEEEQISLSGGEARMGTPGINVTFGGSENSLTCQESTKPSGRCESYSIRPWVTPEPAKRCRWKCRLLWQGWGAAPIPKPPEQGSVGSTISIPSHSPFNRQPPLSSQQFLNILSILLFVIAVATPYIVIKILSDFRSNEATGTQITFTLNWLILGQFQGYFVGDIEKMNGKKNTLKGFLYIFLCYGSYCLGALVIVAQEMIEFGTCKAE